MKIHKIANRMYSVIYNNKVYFLHNRQYNQLVVSNAEITSHERSYKRSTKKIYPSKWLFLVFHELKELL